MSQDPWSLTFHILETLWLDPSVPFEGYKLSHIQALRDSTIQLWEQRHSGEISLHIESTSLCPWKSELLVQPPSSSFFVMENLIDSFIWACLWWRIEVLEAQLEGLSFSVPIYAVTKVCHLCTYVDQFHKNTIFSSNWYLANNWIVFHGCIFHEC